MPTSETLANLFAMFGTAVVLLIVRPPFVVQASSGLHVAHVKWSRVLFISLIIGICVLAAPRLMKFCTRAKPSF